MNLDPMAHPVPRAVRILALVYTCFLIGLAVAHGQPMVGDEAFNPYRTDHVQAVKNIWGTVAAPKTTTHCFQAYTGVSVLTCPPGVTDVQALPQTPIAVAPLPLPSSRILMFGNVVIGQGGAAQDYVPFLNLTNGWMPQEMTVMVMSGDAVWEQSYDVPAWRHLSINLQDVPILKGKTTGFGVFVQVWGVATAAVSLHRASDPWGPAYQTIQPDAIQTPQFINPERN